MTARVDFLCSPRETPASWGEGAGTRGDLFPLSGDLVRSDFFLLFFLREFSVTTSPPQLHHSLQLITGFALFLRFFPQRITCQINFIFALLPTSHSPLLPHRKPRSLRLDILQTIYVVFRIVIFNTSPTPHGYSSRRLFLPFPRLGGRG